MEDILASIRRIISEDEAPVVLGAPPPSTVTEPDEDVLLLTERAPAEPLSPVAEESRGLVAPATALSAAASFDKLAFVVDNAAAPSSIAVTSAGPTLEDITRDLLRPMIKSWLDDNLAAIVRAKVDEEVERIARGRVR